MTTMLPPARTQQLWDALASEPGTGVCINTISGRTTWCNDEAARIYFGDGVSAADLIGKTWVEQGLAKEFIAEKLALVRRVAESKRPALVRTIWRGYQHVAWVYPIEPDEETHETQFLAITRRICGVAYANLESETPVIETTIADFGPLDVLTARELEVLALIGRGLSNKEISAILHRSEKTVDNHRQAIVRKLGSGGRVRLAEIALKAGLEVRDRDRVRV